MLYVAGEILLWMFLAFALGVLVGWFVWGLRQRRVQPAQPVATAAPRPASEIESVTVRTVVKPVAATTPAVVPLESELPVTPPAGQPAVPPLSPPAGEPVIGTATGDLPGQAGEPAETTEPTPTVEMTETVEPAPTIDSPAVADEPQSPSDDLAALADDDSTWTADASAPTPAVGQPAVEPPDGVALGRPEAANDLTVIAGIGDSIEGVLQEAGIVTWHDLSEVTPERLRTLLDLAGDEYRTHDPSTWPRQAELAEAGRWDELAALQATLTTGPP